MSEAKRDSPTQVLVETIRRIYAEKERQQAETPENNQVGLSLLEVLATFYQMLLTLYPSDHCQRFGEEMAYVFHCQCQDAYARSGVFGILKVWISTIIDLFPSAWAERKEAIINTFAETDLISPLARQVETTLIANFLVFAVVALFTGFVGNMLDFLTPFEWNWSDYVFLGLLLLMGIFSFMLVVSKNKRREQAAKQNRLLK